MRKLMEAVDFFGWENIGNRIAGKVIYNPGPYTGKKVCAVKYDPPLDLKENEFRVDLPNKYLVFEIFEELEDTGDELIRHSLLNICEEVGKWIEERGLEKALWDDQKECAFYIFDNKKDADDFKDRFLR